MVVNPQTPQQDSSGLSSIALDGVISGSIVGAILLIVAGVSIYACCVRCKKKAPQQSQSATIEAPTAEDIQLDVQFGRPQSLNIVVPLPVHRRTSGYSRRSNSDLQPIVHKLDTLSKNMEDAHIDEYRLKLDDVIGMGTFGLVYNGKLKDKAPGDKYQLVTVKTLHGHGSTPAVMKQFVEDGLMLQSFSHEQVLPLLGLVIKEDQPLLVLPRYAKGPLHPYITDVKQHFTVRTLINMGLQVANGVKYLVENGFVHQDIATRNCVVYGDGNIRVGDCALSQDMFEEDYFYVEQLSHKALPIGWMAVELLTELNYSLQSDVWSVGVVLWELVTRGQAPYTDMDAETIIAYVRAGQRLERPSVTPSKLYDLMLSCWHEDRLKRPAACTVCATLSSLLNSPL